MNPHGNQTEISLRNHPESNENQVSAYIPENGYLEYATFDTTGKNTRHPSETEHRQEKLSTNTYQVRIFLDEKEEVLHYVQGQSIEDPFLNFS
jgi:hypothetical protein